MSADQPQQPIPPSTPTEQPPTQKKSSGASVGALVGIGIGVILLSFVASFLGASLARSTDNAEATPTPTPLSSAEYVAALEEILPAGSAVRAGTGAPEAGKGYEGDVYIDVQTSDVYVFRGDDWELAGNIRENAAENLTGETGPAGETGETGATGEPGEPGTQLLLGIGEPAAETCEADGDVYIDTELLQFYECAAGEWTLFGPPADEGLVPLPSPTPEP